MHHTHPHPHPHTTHTQTNSSACNGYRQNLQVKKVSLGEMFMFLAMLLESHLQELPYESVIELERLPHLSLERVRFITNNIKAFPMNNRPASSSGVATDQSSWIPARDMTPQIQSFTTPTNQYFEAKGLLFMWQHWCYRPTEAVGQFLSVVFAIYICVYRKRVANVSHV